MRRWFRHNVREDLCSACREIEKRNWGRTTGYWCQGDVCGCVVAPICEHLTASAHQRKFGAFFALNLVSAESLFISFLNQVPSVRITHSLDEQHNRVLNFPSIGKQFRPFSSWYWRYCFVLLGRMDDSTPISNKEQMRNTGHFIFYAQKKK